MEYRSVSFFFRWGFEVLRFFCQTFSRRVTLVVTFFFPSASFLSKSSRERNWALERDLYFILPVAA